MIEVGIFLFGHQMDPAKLDRYGWQLQRLHEKCAPFTYYFSGVTLEAMKGKMVGDKIRQMFPEKAGALNPYDPEIGVSSYHDLSLCPLELELHSWGTYLEHFVDDEIANSKKILWYDFGKDSRGFFPPECIFAPAVGFYLEKNFVDYVIVDGAKLNNWQKSQVFHLPEKREGLKIVPRRNEINVLANAHETVRYILHLAQDLGAKRVVAGCDFDFDNYGMTPEQGLTRLCKLADELFRTEDTEFRNIATISDSAKLIQYPFGHHYTTSWINGEGGLSFLRDPEVKRKNNNVNDFVRYYGSLVSRLPEADAREQELHHKRTKIINDLEDVKRIWLSSVAGIEYRHPGWTRDVDMNDRFYKTSAYLMGKLREIDESIHKLG